MLFEFAEREVAATLDRASGMDEGNLRISQKSPSP